MSVRPVKQNAMRVLGAVIGTLMAYAARGAAFGAGLWVVLRCLP